MVVAACEAKSGVAQAEERYRSAGLNLVGQVNAPPKEVSVVLS